MMYSVLDFEDFVALLRHGRMRGGHDDIQVPPLARAQSLVE